MAYCGLLRLIAAYCGLLRLIMAYYGLLWLIAAHYGSLRITVREVTAELRYGLLAATEALVQIGEPPESTSSSRIAKRQCCDAMHLPLQA